MRRNLASAALPRSPGLTVGVSALPVGVGALPVGVDATLSAMGVRALSAGVVALPTGVVALTPASCHIMPRGNGCGGSERVAKISLPPKRQRLHESAIFAAGHSAPQT